MASITIKTSSITVTGNTVTINYTTDVTLDKVELTKDSTNWITASTYTQTSATFDISSWSDGTYSSCKLRITYEVVSNYGEIVLNTTTIEVNEAGTGIFTVNLDSAPTNNQVVNLAVNNNNCTLDKTSLTFTSSNYSAAQTVTITGAHDANNYADMSSTITLSSNNVSNKTLGVTIKNIDTQTSSGQALDDWDVYNNTYSYNYVAYMASQVGVSGKAIRITAEKETVTVTPTGGTGTTTTKDYVSGGLVTKKAFKYGTFTFKCKLSANDTYLWAMIWTLPDSTTMARPEFDLWESWGSKTSNNIVQTYHAYDSDGNEKTNYQQAMTSVDLTQEHEVKAVWTEDDVFKMYVDGVLKLTINEYMVNWKTGEVDYQVWFLNLGLGTYSGDAPNGTGWMEITDYTFEPVYTRDRVKQHTWCGNWTDGTAPSGDLPGSSGSGDTGNSLTITNVTAGTFTINDTVTISYTTSAEVTKHEFNMNYATYPTGFTNGTTRVTSSGNNHVMTFSAGELSTGTKNGAIRVTDADGNTAIAQYSLVITDGSATTYTITNNLTNCTSSNSNTSITASSSYSATISANSGYELSTLTVTMGGTDITSSAVSGSTISISSVTGNIIITASATEIVSDTLTITNITVLSSTVASTQINYTTNKEVTTHYFNMWYSGTDSGFTNGTSRVTDNGNNNYTMTFENALSAGTKSPAIKVEDAAGNTYIKTFSLTVTS